MTQPSNPRDGETTSVESRRFSAERTLLGCQIAHPRLRLECAREGLYREALHSTIQQAIDGFAAAGRLFNPAQVAGATARLDGGNNHLAYVRTLAGEAIEKGLDPDSAIAGALAILGANQTETQSPASAGMKGESMSEKKPVGYANPPEASQFRKGQSGNPGGRPRGSISVKMALRKAAFGSPPGYLTSLQGMTVLEAMLKAQFEEGMTGNAAAARNLTALCLTWLDDDDVDDSRIPSGTGN